MAVGGIILIKALLARLLFVVHSTFSMIQAHMQESDPIAFLMMVPLLFLCVETYYTLKYKPDGEWNWFCPCVFLFLCTAVPSKWLMERNMMMANTTRFSNEQLTALTFRGIDIGLPISFTRRAWANILEQTLLLVLILARWLLPKRNIGRNKLSQLLLEYIGMAADILELNGAFEEPKIFGKRFEINCVLGTWSLGVSQFAFVLASTRKRKAGVCRPACYFIIETEVWAILLNCVMQDVPFLILRLYLMLTYDIMSQSNIFFTCKNSLVLLLQFYRIYSIIRESCCGTVDSDENMELEVEEVTKPKPDDAETQSLSAEPKT